MKLAMFSMLVVGSLALAPHYSVLGVIESGQTTAENWPTSQRVRDASNMSHAPTFTDLYLIESFDRSRMIHVYCGASSCSRNRKVWMPG